MLVTGESEEGDGDGDCDGGAARRPRWLHPRCVDPAAAMDLGTCCRYPADPLVGRAVELADYVDRLLSGPGPGDDRTAPGGLARLPWLVPGLLAQIHAVLSDMDGTAVAQLSCPVARLRGALDRICPPQHAPDPAAIDPGSAGREAEFEPLRPLLAGCADALRAALRPQRKVRSAACWTRPD